MKTICPFCKRKIDVIDPASPGVTPWLKQHAMGKYAAMVAGVGASSRCMGSNMSLPTASYVNSTVNPAGEPVAMGGAA